MKIDTFFLRVAASCNLDCDYCYVFKHRDMTWKKMPAVMLESTVQSFAKRVREYAENIGLSEVNIIFHGGEPLMCGSNKLIEFADMISDILSEEIKPSYSIQTNGTLITETFLSECEKRNIGISLSIDGHKCVHDKHRRYKNGKSSYNDVLNGIRLLKGHPSIFEGVIGVVDPCFEPENVDLLLPDSTYIDLPKGRAEQPDLYKNWLIRAFDAWFFNHQSLQLRTFEHILAGILGEGSALDAFGLGNLDYLTVETDGTYHTSDILKVAYENASAIGFSVDEGSIEQALSSEKVKQYNTLLSVGALPQKCKECTYSTLCGGGSLPHRYNETNGFNNPSVYCEEMYTLIHHAKEIFIHAIEAEMKNE